MRGWIYRTTVCNANANSAARPRVGYVPLHQCGCWEDWYSEYGRAQADAFSALVDLGVAVAMPAFEAFSRMYMKEQKGHVFFRKKGAHLSQGRQKWLSLAFVSWATANRLSMVLCLGWDSVSLHALGAELKAQKELVVELQRVHL